MTYMSVIVSEEAAPVCIRELGSLGALHPFVLTFIHHSSLY